MQIQVQEQAGGKVVRLFGEFDSATAPEVDQRLQGALAGGQTVVVDFSGVPFMSSAGLRVLQRAAAGANAAGGEVWLAAVPPAVQSVLQQTGFDRLFRSFAGVSDAGDELQRRREKAERAAEPPPSVVVVEGDVDAATAPALERRLRSAVNGGAKRLVLDLRAVTFIASAGLRVLQSILMAARAQEGDLRLAGATPEVQHLLETMGFAALFKSFGSVESAVASYE
jgi:anti-sigma B factor antagonist